jgi:hypothetical protein
MLRAAADGGAGVRSLSSDSTRCRIRLPGASGWAGACADERPRSLVVEDLDPERRRQVPACWTMSARAGERRAPARHFGVSPGVTGCTAAERSY